MRAGRRLGAALVLALTLGVGAGCSAPADERVHLTLLTGTVDANVQVARAVVDSFNSSQSTVVVSLDSSVPAGGEGDGVIKTRLATGDMPDMFWHESGSQLRALSPDATLLDIGDEPWVRGLSPAFVDAVSTSAGVYGAPIGTVSGGGFLYWAPAYEAHGISVPETWEGFLAGARALAREGEQPVLQSYGDPWTAQVMVLADFFNVQESKPGWAVRYTAHEVGFAERPALAGFERLHQLRGEGLLNRDYASVTFTEALDRLATGEAVHYPMLTFALGAIARLHPDSLDEIGYFPIPGDGPLGATVWMPPAVYAPATTPHPAEVRAFLAYLASAGGCEAMLAATTPTGPPVVAGCELPGDAPRAVKDLERFLDREGGSSPALEFLSPVKGVALEQIAVEVGSGIRTAREGALLYDADVAKQARQLGLPGWTD